MNPAERRVSVRRRPREKTFVAMRPDFSRTGKIRDISRGGLSFQYLSKVEVSDPGSDVNVDMFISDNGYYVPSLPCRLIYDRRERGAHPTPPGLEYRVCGLAFGDLNTDQTQQIGAYLQQHTADAV